MGVPKSVDVRDAIIKQILLEEYGPGFALCEIVFSLGDTEQVGHFVTHANGVEFQAHLLAITGAKAWPDVLGRRVRVRRKNGVIEEMA